MTKVGTLEPASFGCWTQTFKHLPKFSTICSKYRQDNLIIKSLQLCFFVATYFFFFVCVVPEEQLCQVNLVPSVLQSLSCVC